MLRNTLQMNLISRSHLSYSNQKLNFYDNQCFRDESSSQSIHSSGIGMHINLTKQGGHLHICWRSIDRLSHAYSNFMGLLYNIVEPELRMSRHRCYFISELISSWLLSHGMLLLSHVLEPLRYLYSVLCDFKIWECKTISKTMICKNICVECECLFIIYSKIYF